MLQPRNERRWSHSMSVVPWFTLSNARLLYREHTNNLISRVTLNNQGGVYFQFWGNAGIVLTKVVSATLTWIFIGGHRSRSMLTLIPSLQLIAPPLLYQFILLFIWLSLLSTYLGLTCGNHFPIMNAMGCSSAIRLWYLPQCTVCVWGNKGLHSRQKNFLGSTWKALLVGSPRNRPNAVTRPSTLSPTKLSRVLFGIGLSRL